MNASAPLPVQQPPHLPRFVHLRMHTEFSVSDGIILIDQVVARAAADGMPALGISDLANLFGMVKFYKAARDKPARVLLICRNRAGYGRLCELLTRAYLENKHRGRAELRREWLDGAGAEGLLCLSGALSGDVGVALANGNRELT